MAKIDLAHATLADEAADLIQAKAATGSETHGVSPSDGGGPLSDLFDEREAPNAAPRATPIAIPTPRCRARRPTRRPRPRRRRLRTRRLRASPSPQHHFANEGGHVVRAEAGADLEGHQLSGRSRGILSIAEPLLHQGYESVRMTTAAPLSQRSLGLPMWPPTTRSVRLRPPPTVQFRASNGHSPPGSPPIAAAHGLHLREARAAPHARTTPGRRVSQSWASMRAGRTAPKSQTPPS